MSIYEIESKVIQALSNSLNSSTSATLYQEMFCLTTLIKSHIESLSIAFSHEKSLISTIYTLLHFSTSKWLFAKFARFSIFKNFMM